MFTRSPHHLRPIRTRRPGWPRWVVVSVAATLLAVATITVG